ncbi:superoxide dismutase [Cu-Zn] [Toxorhynchites rutilus septentrionalis]|uniref:superoxide dismutase [Cu-Zn] n=1 Tax=Toxorhynchites rutilus septentrionalis TaxID=329112 RepID=UPI00247914F4|nr:superoxide dismutase [Cu-Zn] [Toxorhynchites rutilus septentrionalis]
MLKYFGCSQFLLVASILVSLISCAKLTRRALVDDVEFITPSGLGLAGLAPLGPSGFRGIEILPRPQPSWRAGATLVADNPEQQIMGVISFKQWAPGHVETVINVTGLPTGKHAVHVHAFGDMREGCKSTGPHFRSSIIGNIDVKEDGSAVIDFHSPYINLFGYAGIVGRSIVIHEKPSEIYRFPDLSINNPVSFQGEEDTVGARIACGIITILDNVSSM